MKIIVIAAGVLVIGCFAGLGATMWLMYGELNSARNAISKAEEELDKAKKENEKNMLLMQEKVAELKDQAAIAKKQNKKLKEKMKASESTSESGDAETNAVETVAAPAPASTAAPEPTPSFRIDELEGSWVDTYSSRTKMTVSCSEGGYGIFFVIDGSTGAATGVKYNLVSNGIDPAGNFEYSGSKYNYEYPYGGSGPIETLISSDEFGVITYSNGMMTWNDHKSGETLSFTKMQ